MPIVIENNCDSLSLNDLVALRAQGFSVLKSPHVGNQHPSNLACAALQLPLEMVTFTSPSKDVNFHPHLRIAGGSSTALFPPETLTQFATVPDGRTATEYHQSSVKTVFPKTDISTDIERMQSVPELTEVVLRQSNHAVRLLWYRRVCSSGTLTSVRDQERLSEHELTHDVFQITNRASGWVIPNRAHALFDFIWQSLSSGRDVIYHLSGPQMAGYIGGAKASLGTMYDAVRGELPELPEVLTIRIVPVASCRFVTVTSERDALSAVQDLVRWYESLPNEDRRFATERFSEVAATHPEFVRPIESAATRSQYDLGPREELLLDPWMLTTPLSRVAAIYRRLVKAGEAEACKKAA